MYIHTAIYAHTAMYIHTAISVHTGYMCMCACTYIAQNDMRNLYVCISFHLPCVCVCVHICTHTHTCIHTYISLSLSLCTHTHTHTHTHLFHARTRWGLRVTRPRGTRGGSKLGTLECEKKKENAKKRKLKTQKTQNPQQNTCFPKADSKDCLDLFLCEEKSAQKSALWEICYARTLGNAVQRDF